jgi:alanyl-tRNA synthetase
VEIPSAPLVPENDPTTLFTSSGMQPLIPYLLGQKHPLGKRLVDSQKSFRAQDIDEVGDNRHTTFFEMLGNWSLGDPARHPCGQALAGGYFKKEQLPWIWEFLTKVIKLDPKKLYVSVFAGNESVSKDIESINIWKEIFEKEGISSGVAESHFAEAPRDARIYLYGAGKNWWSRSGEPEKMPAGEPGGPDSEVFYDFGTPHDPKFGATCHPNCDCGRFMEIANSVFMQYQKMPDGSLKELAQKNVDFGGGLERLVAVTEKTNDVFKTDLFIPILDQITAVSKITYAGNEVSMRILADHIKGAVMMIDAGVLPSNKGQGYILRRLIRRALLHGRKLNNFIAIETLVEPIEKIYQNKYPTAAEILKQEALKFSKTLEKGLSEIEKIPVLDGKIAFTLYETYGFPWEMTVEIAKEKGQQVDRAQFEEEFKKHQELSRTAAKGMFKGGLADHSVQTTRLHTAHHLLLAALQKLVDPTIRQRGSNITVERLRMDFNFARKVTPEEIQKVEALVNETIKKDLKVERVEMPREEAEKVGAQMEFGHKYPDRVSVYFVGPRDHFFSAEFCGGPHVTHTGELGSFKIIKEESAGSGIRRIYATLQ